MEAVPLLSQPGQSLSYSSPITNRQQCQGRPSYRTLLTMDSFMVQYRIMSNMSFNSSIKYKVMCQENRKQERVVWQGIKVEYKLVIHIFSEVTDALATLHVKTVRQPRSCMTQTIQFQTRTYLRVQTLKFKLNESQKGELLPNSKQSSHTYTASPEYESNIIIIYFRINKERSFEIHSSKLIISCNKINIKIAIFQK